MARYVVLELLIIPYTTSRFNHHHHHHHHHHPMIIHVKERYTNFIHEMHTVRQQQQQQMIESPKTQLYSANNNSIHDTTDRDDINHNTNSNIDMVDTDESSSNRRIYRIFTDSDDPMGLHHPMVGLEHNSPYFTMVSNIEEADIVFSYQSIFSPQYIHYEYLQKRMRNSDSNMSNNNDNYCSHSTVRINQFPYEGAFVQKDHLARGILQQHGLPRPSWSIETYDLDVHFVEFVGSILFAMEDQMNQGEQHQKQQTSTTTSTSATISTITNPIWILKPASGTQSQGHVVTRNVAQILRINDAVGGRRVAQRYIERPVCIHHRKVDCRVIVLMTSAGSMDENGQIVQLPTLYMHNTCYFRIANKAHNISTPIDRNDHESVLTASHLLHDHQRTTKDVLQKLPQHKDTIDTLEKVYPNAFEWEDKILPQIQTMIRELFNGMTRAYPKMIEAKHSRAMYGVDVMFQIDDDDNGDGNMVITPKLTEVTFCPANNAICDVYVRDEELYRTYNRDIFECLFIGIVSNNMTRLQ